MNFENTTIDEVKSIFEAGFKILECRNVSPFQKKDDAILLTVHSDFMCIYLESKNIVTHSANGSFTIETPSVSEAAMNFEYDENGVINYLNFDAKHKQFNILAALKRMQEIGLSVL